MCRVIAELTAVASEASGHGVRMAAQNTHSRAFTGGSKYASHLTRAICRYLLFGAGVTVLVIGIHLLLRRDVTGHEYSFPQLAFWGSLCLQWWGAFVISMTTVGWKGWLDSVQKRHGRSA